MILRLNLLLVCLSVLALTPVVQAQNDEPLLSNAGFEEGPADKPAHWTLYDWRGESQLDVTEQNARTGRALRIVIDNAAGRASVTQARFKQQLAKGTTLRIAGYYRADNVTLGDKPMHRVDFVGNEHDKAHISRTALKLKPVAQWTYFQHDVTLKHDTDRFALRILLQRVTGTWMFDDLSLSIVSGADELTLFSLKQPPAHIDGRFDEPFWATAQQAVDLLTLSTRKLAPSSTVVRTTYDDHNLYFAVRADDERMDKIETDAESPWSGDCVEFFFAPNPEENTWYQVVVDAAGNAVAMQHGDSATHRLPVDIEAAALLHEDHWTLEVRLPFAMFGTSMPADNARWRFNVGRERYVTESGKRQQFISSWSPVGMFADLPRWGNLAFYSKHEIEADLAYWDDSDRDPLMLRPVVSGYEIASRQADELAAPTLWDYRPFDVELKHAPTWSERGLTDLTRQQFPEFYDAAMALNHLLIDKTHSDLKLASVQRIAHYAGRAKDPELAKCVADSHKLDTSLNNLYQQYGKAYDADRDVSQLSRYHKNVEQVRKQLASLDKELVAISASLRSQISDRNKNDVFDTAIKPTDDYRNSHGIDTRIRWLAHEFWQNEPVLIPLGEFDSHTIHRLSIAPESTGLGDYQFSKLREAVKRRQQQQIKSYYFWPSVGLHDYVMPLPQWLLDCIEADPDILLRSEDGKVATDFQAPGKINKRGVNPNHPIVRQYVREYITKLTAVADEIGDFRCFIFGNETNNYFRVMGEKGKVDRSVGYNPTGVAAFRRYLQDRYQTISQLNRKWKTSYAAFDDIDSPSDRFIAMPDEPSALRYEHERWTRVNHVEFLKLINDAAKTGAPDVPTLVDPSKFMLEGNAYLLYKYDVADIYSAHSVPRNDEPMWVYLNSLNRRFDKITGYYENYWGMHRRQYLAQERLAKRVSYQFFFDMLMRDVRVPGWWLRYNASDKRVLTAYNTNPFDLNYGQTIYRWSTTALPGMYARGRAIEKVLLETDDETPRVAIVQPCASVFHVASLGRTYVNSPTLTGMLDWQRSVVAPLNVSHEFIMEELWQDGRVDLEQYDVLLLPHAPFMSDAFARAIASWVQQGGTLISVGPIALYDELAQPSSVGRQLQASVLGNVEQTINTTWLRDAGPTQLLGTDATVRRTVGQGKLIILNAHLGSLVNDPAWLKQIQQMILTATSPTARADSPSAKLIVRVTDAGRRFLAIANRSVDQPLRTTVRVAGRYESPVDLLADNSPIPAQYDGGATTLNVWLAPGDWTVIDLGMGE